MWLYEGRIGVDGIQLWNYWVWWSNKFLQRQWLWVLQLHLIHQWGKPPSLGLWILSLSISSSTTAPFSDLENPKHPSNTSKIRSKTQGIYHTREPTDAITWAVIDIFASEWRDRVQVWNLLFSVEFKHFVGEKLKIKVESTTTLLSLIEEKSCMTEYHTISVIVQTGLPTISWFIFN